MVAIYGHTDILKYFNKKPKMFMPLRLQWKYTHETGKNNFNMKTPKSDTWQVYHQL